MRDGSLVSAIAEERLSRVKSDGGRLPNRAIDAVLEAAGARRQDVDAIAAGFYSGFPTAAVITIDGEGDLDLHHSMSIYRNGRLETRRISNTVGSSPGYLL